MRKYKLSSVTEWTRSLEGKIYSSPQRKIRCPEREKVKGGGVRRMQTKWNNVKFCCPLRSVCLLPKFLPQNYITHPSVDVKSSVVTRQNKHPSNTFISNTFSEAFHFFFIGLLLVGSTIQISHILLRNVVFAQRNESVPLFFFFLFLLKGAFLMCSLAQGETESSRRWDSLRDIQPSGAAWVSAASPRAFTSAAETEGRAWTPAPLCSTWGKKKNNPAVFGLTFLIIHNELAHE